MTSLQQMLFRIFEWVFFLGGGIGAIVLGIYLGELGLGKSFMYYSFDIGKAENWILFFVGIFFSIAIYLQKGINKGGWRVSGNVILQISIYSIAVFGFGFYGLIVILVLDAIRILCMFINKKLNA